MTAVVCHVHDRHICTESFRHRFLANRPMLPRRQPSRPGPTNTSLKIKTRTSGNKKAQLSLGKTRYSLYSFCSSTDLQGHPRSIDFHVIWKGVCHLLLLNNSNLGRMSHCFWDMFQFSLQKCTFFLVLSIQLQIWKCSALHQIVEILQAPSPVN